MGSCQLSSPYLARDSLHKNVFHQFSWVLIPLLPRMPILMVRLCLFFTISLISFSMISLPCCDALYPDCLTGSFVVSSIRCSISVHVPRLPSHAKHVSCSLTTFRSALRSSGFRDPVKSSSTLLTICLVAFSGMFSCSTGVVSC